MGNKASTEVAGCQGANSEHETVKTMSCSSLGTEPSDDKLRELVQATAAVEASAPPKKAGVNIFIGLNPALGKLHLFQPPEPPQPPPPPPPPRIKIRLCHCETDNEHRAYVAEILERAKDLCGEEGLRVAGFEYRKVYCPEHEQNIVVLDNSVQKNIINNDSTQEEEKKCDIDGISEQGTVILDSSAAKHAAVMKGLTSSNSDGAYKPCFQCAMRLFYCETNTLITEDNRKLYIADGQMYDEVARLAQEFAQEEMRREGNLEWVTVCHDPAHSQPVRALVHKDHHLVSDLNEKESTADDRPTLLIATGKGKVMAGIFSRQHLLTTGLEASTALPMVIEANQRNMSVVIFDPNARGDRQGMDTFEKSFEAVLGYLDYTNVSQSQPAVEQCHAPSKRALYIVAHSASGSQLVRYMLARVHGYLPYLRAIAFTDSTHNIQWTRKNAALQSLLGSRRCVYFRSASKRHDDLWETRKAGDAVETDSFWEHRFGQIRTLWAGTEEHSLMNWFAHVHIWDHFDEHLQSDVNPSNEESDS